MKPSEMTEDELHVAQMLTADATVRAQENISATGYSLHNLIRQTQAQQDYISVMEEIVKRFGEAFKAEADSADWWK